jgi:peptide deformylase
MTIFYEKFSFMKEPSDEFDFSNPPFDPIEFSKDLVKEMYDHNGICLAAPQLLIPYRIFAMRGQPQNIVCFNPKVVNASEEKILLEEKSLTYPGLIVKIKRPRHIRVRFSLPNSETVTETFTGMTARAFLQSMDFLDGYEFYRHAHPVHREAAFRLQKQWERKHK